MCAGLSPGSDEKIVQGVTTMDIFGFWLHEAIGLHLAQEEEKQQKERKKKQKKKEAEERRWKGDSCHRDEW